MQHISLNGLCTLLSEGTFMPPQSNMPPELSRTMAILLVFHVDSEHKRIINVYVGLVVHRVDSHLYSPSQINDFIQDIDEGMRCSQGWARCWQEGCLLPICGQSQWHYVHPNRPSLLSGVSHHLCQRH